MYSDFPWHHATTDPDPTELQLRVDFFRKLGYSPREVRAALLKLGLSTDTNAVLGELVRNVAGSDMPEAPAGQRGPVGVGGSPTKSHGANRDAPPSAQEVRREAESELKPIVIDGSNVAMSHGNKEVFSCRGIELAVNYFLDRGHRTVTVFVPSWRKEQPRADVPIADQHILGELEKKKIVVFTPSRRVGGKRVVCYDDRFIVKLAHESDGVIVSNDTYRDLQAERPEWKQCIDERLLMYSFVNDKFMPPDDPLGRQGPSLENFLRKNPQLPEQKRQLCPYGKKCTYGMKCKFSHPERANQFQRSLADELRENARLSAVCEERSPAPSLWGPQSDPGLSFSSAPLSLERQLSLDLHGPPQNTQGIEISPQYWNGTRSRRKAPSYTLDPPPSSTSHDRLDSGLGSYEGPYSEASQIFGHAYRSRHQQHCFPPGAKTPGIPGSRGGCSTDGEQQEQGSPGLAIQTGLSNYMYLPGGQHYSLPCSFQHGELHPYQHNYWSDSFQGVPRIRTSQSLTNPMDVPGPCREQLTWARPPPATLQAEREEVRKKLKAIFNPYQVDKVMGMFPQLTDAEKLAAEIFNLKSKGGIL